MNKFQQVSSLGHQVSLPVGGVFPVRGDVAGGAVQKGIPVQGAGGFLYDEVQCIMGNGHMGPPHGQTNTHD